MTKKLLIVDDMRPSRLVVKKFLTPFDIEVVEAENAKAALDVLRKHPDIAAIVLDIEMPDMNGIRLLSMIKNIPAWSSIPVIMATANDDKEIVLGCIQAGASAYIVKPFSKVQFIEKMLAVMKQANG